MKPQHFSDAYWTARFAPYVLVVALIAFVASLFWIIQPLVFSFVAFFSGISVFAFHVLRWRTGREVFQILAMASGLIPLWIMLSRLHRAEQFQYMTIFFVSYTAAVVAFRSRVLRGEL